MNINKWFAKQCAIEFEPSSLFRDQLGELTDWDIKDPRCMQVVREKFGLSTLADYEDGWACGTQEEWWLGEGKTIPEAEYACCVAIYNARGDK